MLGTKYGTFWKVGTMLPFFHCGWEEEGGEMAQAELAKAKLALEACLSQALPGLADSFTGLV